MRGLRWLGWVVDLLGVLAGVSVFAIAAFLLDQRWDIAVILGLIGFIVIVLEGSYRQSCREKDALDPQWREKARALKR